MFSIKKKSKTLDKFKIFKTEIKKQLEKTIKIVRSDRKCKYCGKYGVARRVKGPFVKYLEHCGIITQFTMSSSPKQKSVFERQHRTFKDMMRSIQVQLIFLTIFEMRLLIALYIINKVPSKSVVKIAFELWTGRKSSINHL